ncbi:MAG TPA: tetratricopeptide repeat protein [Xanthobacteraceae bacterium]|nr:tetratricopeptide repeat protein [Xanthobacteraceae bacterium]
MVSERPETASEVSPPSSAGTRLRGLIKRPAVWLLGILGTIATAYVTATLHDLAKPLQSYVSDLSCEWRKSNLSPDEPKFTILVARLYKDDDEGSHTRRLFETFQGERGFRPVLLCDTLRFDYRPGEEIKQAEEATIKRGQDLIVQHKADLVIFGEVLQTNNSLRVFAINEHGGCDTRPKPMILRDGVVPDEFDQTTRMRIIGVTLREIASACDSEEYVDWDLFEKRIQKMGPFIERSAAGFSPEQYTEAVAAYAEAMMLLYRNDRGDHWHAKGLEFNQEQLKKLPADASPYRRFLLLNAHALLVGAKGYRTGNLADQQAGRALYDQAIAEAERDPQPRAKYAEAYFSRYCACEGDDVDQVLVAYDRAIKLRPDYSWGYERRGDAFVEKGDLARAIAEYTSAIRFDPKNRSAFVARGTIYARNGDHDRAIKDYDQAIRLNPKHPIAFTWRASSYALKGELDRSIRDLDEAIRINPKDDVSISIRGVNYSDKGDYDRAIQDFNEAARLNPKSYFTFQARGTAYQRKGDAAQAVRDYDQAIALKPDDLSLFLYRGWATAALGDFDRAIQDYDQALRLDPKLEYALYGRAIAHSNSARHDLAIADYDAALGLRPDWAEPLYGRGIAKMQDGDAAGGKADIAKATAIDAQVAKNFARHGGRT